MASAPRFTSVTNVDHVAVRESVVKAVQTLGYDYPPPVKRPSTGNSTARAVAACARPRVPIILSSDLLAQLLVDVFPCRRARSKRIYDSSHMTVTLRYEISIRMLTQHNQEY